MVVLREVTWADYQRLMEIRGDRSEPGLHFAAGCLEIMSPSKDHENLKSLIGRLIETYCLEAGLEFSTFGSWTLEDKTVNHGIEPDECYVFGPARAATRPDLAIGVGWTSGRLSKVETYQALGVREVWFWRRGVITPYVLGADGYATVAASAALPLLDLPLLASFLDRPTTSEAPRAYRDVLRTHTPPAV